MDLKNLLNISPYSLSTKEKDALFSLELQKLTLHHYQNCHEYAQILDKLKFNPCSTLNSQLYPFLPVQLFKNYNLSSVSKEKIVSTLKSSGTSGQNVSKIVLDKETVVNQKKVLAKITSDFIGNHRLPMLVLDSSSVLTNRSTFSARGAGILGFGVFGLSSTFAFDENMQLDFKNINIFLEKFKGQKILLFGFTYIVWQYFVQALLKAERKIDLNCGILIHGGGWKKMTDLTIDTLNFKKQVKEVSGISHVHNYYGMAEQTGSIFMECVYGHYHCSIYSDIFIRRNDLSLCTFGEKGLIEVISLLPRSYPGHVLLTEDQGTLIGEDDCPCGRLGKYFHVHGRIKNAEMRGCSDTFQG